MIQIQYAEKFVQSLGLDVNIVDWDGTDGNYNRETDTISLNLTKIHKNHRRGKSSYPYAKSLTEYIKLIICHELGHRDDYSKKVSVIDQFKEIDERAEQKYYLVDDFCEDVKKEIVDLLIKHELNAWELGKKYVSLGSEINYDLMNKKYIEECAEKNDKIVDEILAAKRNLAKLRIEKEVLMEKNKL